MNQKAGHIVFDCDGTLISSLVSIMRDVQAFLKNHFAKDLTLEDVLEAYSPNMRRFASNLGLELKTFEDEARLLRLWSEQMSQGKHEHELFPGIKDLLIFLQKKNFALYVWTARDRFSTVETLKKLGILNFFDDLRCVNDCMPKPSSEGLEEMLEGVSKESIVVIGDSITDIEGGKSFGAFTIAAVWCTLANKSDLKSYSPHFMAYRPSDCEEIIESLFMRK